MTEDTSPSEGTAIPEALIHAQEPEELLGLLKEFGFSDQDIAEGTGTDVRTVRRWKTGHPGTTAAARLAEMRNLVLLLHKERILSDRGIVFWMRHPNLLLEDYSPAAVVAEGGFRSAREAANCFCDSERGFDEELPADVLDRLRARSTAKQEQTVRRPAEQKRLEPVGS
jgi:hypothetical protein